MRTRCANCQALILKEQVLCPLCEAQHQERHARARDELLRLRAEQEAADAIAGKA